MKIKARYVKELMDIDGNSYKTIIVGDKIWTAENLKVRHYRNGDEIPIVSGEGLTTGACCVYKQKEKNVKTCGLLYNHFAVRDERHLAPEGWHVSTDADWCILETSYGMWAEEMSLDGYRATNVHLGCRLKDTSMWKPPNEWAMNEFGFSALPAGFYDGKYSGLGEYAYFWTYNYWDFNHLKGVCRRLSYDDDAVYRGSRDVQNCYSVRLVKDWRK